MKNAVVIGASSGIGRELAKILAKNGYGVGLIARRENLLRDLRQEMPALSFVKPMDISKTDAARGLLLELIAEMQDVELFVINAGVGFLNFDLSWEPEKETIDVNVSGFAAMAGVAWEHLQKRGGGHLVGISSIAAIRGNEMAPAYNASKAFVSSYLEGLRKKAFKQHLPIVVTEILPGYVKTAMAKGPNQFWVAPAEKAAAQIFIAIRKKKRRAYITKRWRWIAWLFRILPDRVFDRI